MNAQLTYLAKELWIPLTKSKLPIASPLRAGLKDAVKSLNARRLSPSSISGILLIMFNNATLAQALLIVLISLIQFNIYRLDLETDLVCEPDFFRAALLLVVWVFFFPSEQKNQAIYWPTIATLIVIYSWPRQSILTVVA